MCSTRTCEEFHKKACILAGLMVVSSSVPSSNFDMISCKISISLCGGMRLTVSRFKAANSKLRYRFIMSVY
jgi:hypothetical protein